MQTSPPPGAARHPLLLGLVEAFRLDLIVVPSALVVATSFWIIGLGAQLDYSVIPEWALALWGVVHGLSVSTIGFDFSFAPGLITLGVWLLLASGASRIATALSDVDRPPAAERAFGWWTACLVALGGFALAYAGPLVALAVVVGDAAATPFGLLRVLVLMVSAFAFGFLRVRGVADLPWADRLGEGVWATATTVARRLLWAAAGAAVLVVGVGLALRWDDLAEAVGSYSSPLAAGIGLVVLQVLFAPGVLYGALSWVAGTGVDLGAGGVSSAFASTSGPVPDVPVLELLIGDYPSWTQAAPALLVLIGLGSVVIGRAHAQAVLAGSWIGLCIAGSIVVVALGVLALFSAGAIGPLGLADFGPSPLISALAITAWIGLGMSIGLVLVKLSHMQFDAEDDGGAPAAAGIGGSVRTAATGQSGRTTAATGKTGRGGARR